MAPVFFRERVVIKTRLLQFNETEILMEGVMSNENESFAKSVVWINFIYFDLDKGRVVKHTEELMNHWRKISFGSPEIDMADFDGRVEQIKSQFQK